jgi:sensor histidine kinase YesM
LQLAESFYKEGELLKSEGYFQKAKKAFEKTNDANGIAKSSRGLAQVQEDLNNTSAARDNYATALANNIKAGDNTSNTLNSNDLKRLSLPDSFKLQERWLNKNVYQAIQNGDTNEIIQGYSRLGNLNLQNGNFSPAISAFNGAYNFSRNSPIQASKFNQLIADAYVQEKDFTNAIATKKVIFNETFVANSSYQQALQTNALANIYLQQNDDRNAIAMLDKAYALSMQHGHTLEAIKSLQKLDSIYKKSERKDSLLQLYNSFLLRLPNAISKDSSLIDAKVMAISEARIKELETDKNLKEELIHKKNVFNYWLLGFLILLVVFLGLGFSLFKKLRTKNKKIALQSLRREMNPHFIFNSLNSINQFIAQNNELEANQYLTKFSMLMRRVMENSKDDFVLLSKEVELLKHYLSLEKTRFPEKFDYQINMDNDLLEDEQLFVPSMLIQPFLENAIWHGLRYVEGKGRLQLSLIKKDSGMDIRIEDNGIGIAKSKEQKTGNQQQHSSRGMNNTLERIKILNGLYHQHISCNIEDKAQPNQGVVVVLSFPLLKNFQA